ncbi:MAG: hypothetical protein AB7G15_00280 [Alphaproteobacteria bacterium]
MVEVLETGKSRGGLYFIVGALLVAVLVIGFFVFGGNFGSSSTKQIDLKIETTSKK